MNAAPFRPGDRVRLVIGDAVGPITTIITVRRDARMRGGWAVRTTLTCPCCDGAMDLASAALERVQ